MIRKKIYTGTVAVSTADVISISDNVHISEILLLQSLVAIHNFNGVDSTVFSRDQTSPDFLVSGVLYVYKIDMMGSINLVNNSVSNVLDYTIYGKEYL